MDVWRIHRALVIALSSFALSLLAAGAAPRIEVLPRDPAPRVDVLVHGQPFTSYVYLRSLAGPILDPVRAATGAVVTLDATGAPAGAAVRPAGRVGFWFRHGDVNGIDFSGLERPGAGQRGAIAHRRVIEATSSDTRGQLGIEAAWMGPDQTPVLIESTWFVFGAGERTRSLDRITRLTAARGPVLLRRNPRGQAGVRLAQGFLGERAVLMIAERRVDRASLAGTRSRWAAVSGAAGAGRVTVALFDHPDNPGFPATWNVDDEGSLETVPDEDVRIDTGRSVTFRHSLLVLSGPLNAEALEREYQAFIARH